MTKLEALQKLNEVLLKEMPEYSEWQDDFDKDYKEDQWDLFRSLVNVRPAKPARPNFLKLQDKLLKAEIEKKGIIDINDLVPIQNNIYLWKGDITCLKVDAIVNAANTEMTGCWEPNHFCIDNSIHTFAGVQLRLECDRIIKEQGCLEATGQAKITPAYNLPSKFILHTVGPIIYRKLEEKHKKELESCYVECTKLAVQHKIESIAFCGISTGVFSFPKKNAAEIAVATVKRMQKEFPQLKIVFNVFKDDNFEIYKNILA